MFSRLEFFLTETILGFRRHPAMASAAIICVASALFVAGLIGLGILNADRMVKDEVGRVALRLLQSADSRDDAPDAANRIAQLPGVTTTEFVTKETGLGEMARKDQQLTTLVGTNPLPDSVVVKTTTLTAIPALQEQIKDFPEVDSTSDAPEVSNFLLNAGKAVRFFGTIIGLVLGLISLVIIHHTIELTLYARRKEIQIMSLVGATPTTVAMPFLLEGIVYGIIGGGLGWPDCICSTNTCPPACKRSSTPRSCPRAHPAAWHPGILAAGAVLGLLGSLVSVIKYLNQPALESDECVV